MDRKKYITAEATDRIFHRSLLRCSKLAFIAVLAEYKITTEIELHRTKDNVVFI